MKLIIIEVIEDQSSKMKKMAKFGSSIHSIGGANREEKLEFRAKMVKFANQLSK